MVDSQLFGLNAGGHLFVNVLIHVSNTLLLFFFLKRVTGATWSSAIVAAVFALHPLHVESVAWAAERKDTLSTSPPRVAAGRWDQTIRQSLVATYSRKTASLLSGRAFHGCDLHRASS